MALMEGGGENRDLLRDLRHRTADGEQSDVQKQSAAPSNGIRRATVYSGMARFSYHCSNTRHIIMMEICWFAEPR